MHPLTLRCGVSNSTHKSTASKVNEGINEWCILLCWCTAVQLSPEYAAVGPLCSVPIHHNFNGAGFLVGLSPLVGVCRFAASCHVGNTVNAYRWCFVTYANWQVLFTNQPFTHITSHPIQRIHAHKDIFIMPMCTRMLCTYKILYGNVIAMGSIIIYVIEMYVETYLCCKNFVCPSAKKKLLLKSFSEFGTSICR